MDGFEKFQVLKKTLEICMKSLTFRPFFKAFKAFKKPSQRPRRVCENSTTHRHFSGDVISFFGGSKKIKIQPYATKKVAAFPIFCRERRRKRETSYLVKQKEVAAKSMVYCQLRNKDEIYWAGHPDTE